MLAVATGTLALSQRASWTRSVHDQAAFSTGADVRVQASQPLSAAQAGALVRAPGVRRAMPVVPFDQTATDFSPLVAKVKAAAPDGFLVWGAGPAPVIITKQMEGSGIPLLSDRGVTWTPTAFALAPG